MALPVEIHATRIEDAPVDNPRLRLLLRVVADEHIVVIRVAAPSETDVGAIIPGASLALKSIGPVSIGFVEVVVIAEAVAGAIKVARLHPSTVEARICCGGLVAILSRFCETTA